MNKVCATIIALASVFAVCAAMASAAVTTSATDEYCYNFTNKTIAVSFGNDLTGELSTTLTV